MLSCSLLLLGVLAWDVIAKTEGIKTSQAGGITRQRQHETRRVGQGVTETQKGTVSWSLVLSQDAWPPKARHVGAGRDEIKLLIQIQMPRTASLIPSTSKI